MLYYRKTGDTTPHPNETKIFSEKEQELRDNPILTYLNWSYIIEHHIRIKELIEAIKIFDEEHLPRYVRIFNEIPHEITIKFLNDHSLKRNDLEKIYKRLTTDYTLQLNNNYWRQYDKVQL